MSLRVLDALSGEKEDFVPLTQGHYRYLKFLGYQL